jgi:RNA polymerase sigma factor (sigma-70 family)
LNSLVRHIRRAVSGSNDGVTDGELLKRFVAHRDEDAFASLIRRYAPLVFGVCQRVLHQRQDAEDAFQATFLVLLHKAGSITRPEGLGNWLYGVAYYTAKNAGRMTARQRARERQVTEMAKAQPAANEEISRELRSMLDEELSRLPEKYRVPVVLCELQGKSRKDVAMQLGCPEGTISSRLARGRAMLRRPLTKRGLALPLGSLGLLLARDPASASVPPLLVAGTIKTALLLATAQSPAVGVVSAQVAALTEGVLKTMLLAKLKILTGLVVALSVVAGAGLLARQALADKPAPPNIAVALSPGKPVEPAAQDSMSPVEVEVAKDLLTFSGLVLDPEGKPVAHARLYVERPSKDQRPGQDQITQHGTTGADGRFTLKLPRADVRPVLLIAAADGFGIDWIELPQKNTPGDVTFHLVKDVPIRGRVLSTEGKPIAGVGVEVVGIMVPGNLEEFLKALQREWRAAETMMTKQLSLPVTKVLRVTSSDNDGRLEIAGAGAQRLVALQLTHPSLAKSDVLVLTSEATDVKAFNQALSNSSSRRESRTGRFVPVLSGPSFEHIAEPGRVIEGTIREAGTGKPVTGANIQANGNVSVSAALSDAAGRYRIVGLRKAERYTLRVTPPANRPLIGSEVGVPDTTGRLEPRRADLELSRGGVVKGRVLDKATRKGVESFVQFVPLPGNSFAVNAAREQALATFTDKEGQFCLGTLPGPGVLLAQVTGTRETINGVRVHPYPVNRYKRAEFDAEDKKRLQRSSSLPDSRSFTRAGGGRTSLQFFSACRVVDVPEGNEAVSCDLIVDPGKTLTVNVEDPDGKPLAGAIAAGVTITPLGAVSLKNATCPVYALDPGKPRLLVLLHQERELAAVVTLRGDEEESLTVRLGPTGVLTGRLLDQDGQPIRGAQVAALYAGQVGNDLARELRRRFELPRTDDQGRFRLQGIVPGLKFDLGFIKGRQQLKAESRKDILPLQPRQTVELGDLRVKPEH